MSGIIEVGGDWLALREGEDARARSRELAVEASDLLGPGPVVVHDLGSGTGSMMRWLAPVLAGPQTWVLHDWNAQLVEDATRTAVPRDREGRPVSVRTSIGPIARLSAGDLDGAALVTASALLDVLTSDELDAIARACIATGCPVLLSLSVTGDVRLDPADARDERVRTAFNAHQRRRIGGRRLVGPSGAALARTRFEAAGWKVREATTVWRLGPHDPTLLARWFDGWLSAALEQRPGLEVEVGMVEYREARLSQLREGALSAVVLHTDLLAESG